MYIFVGKNLLLLTFKSYKKCSDKLCYSDCSFCLKYPCQTLDLDLDTYFRPKAGTLFKMLPSPTPCRTLLDERLESSQATNCS